MFFKKLRSRSKSSSKSTKASIGRVTSGSSTHNGTMHSKIPEVTISPPIAPLSDVGEDDGESRDYIDFLEKARRDAEKAEKDKMREIKRARELNMSPWARRM